MLKHLWIDSLPEPWQTGEEREWAEEMTAPFGTRYPGMAPAMAAALKPAALETASCSATSPPGGSRCTAAEIAGAPVWYFWWD
jgi:hypothetical protein